MSGTGKNKNRLSGLFRRNRGLEITGYHVGDIRTDQNVIVAESGAVAGNIYAPEVSVAGLLKGLIAAKTTEIMSSGQVWGDVYATTLTINPGGKLHGWFSTIGEEGYQLLNSGSASLKEVTSDSQEAIPDFMESASLPATLLEESTEERQSSRLGIMRRLQAEAASASIARRELELTFEERLAEAAGEEMTTAVALREELIVVRAELMTIHTQLDDANAILEEQENALELQAERLQNQATELANREEKISELVAQVEGNSDLLERTNSSMTELNLQLVAELDKSGALSERTANLEMALQGSLERGSELEEALLHWQELAEESNAQIAEIKTERENLTTQLVAVEPELLESRSELARLQDELNETADLLTTTQVELSKLQAAETELLTLRSVHEQAADELEKLRLESSQQPQALVVAENTVIEYAERINALEAELIEAKDKSQHYHERLLWAEATRQNTGTELAEIQTQLESAKSRVSELEKQQKDLQSSSEDWKENVGNSLQRLSAAEAEVQSLREELAAGKAQVDAAAKQAEELKLAHSLMEAKEEEITRYVGEMNSQGQKLANLHANLVDREMAFDSLRQEHASQADELTRVKKVAGERIKQLNDELGKARKQLKEVAAWMERRRRQE